MHQQQQQPQTHLQQQQQRHEQHSHQQQIHCHAHTYAEPHQHQQQPASTPHVQQQQQHPQRKHSHSPHPSRHTSPHSHHSHSLHSSPHQSHPHVHDADSLARNHPPRPSTQSSSSHAHHHHTHRRRRRPSSHHHRNANSNGNSNNGGNAGGGGGSGNSSTHGTNGHREPKTASRQNQHHPTCSRRHRSATDVSSTSVNTCHDPGCTDREVQEILIRKNCCSSSRTELAQYFAEDLYGTSRRPSSCCTSSDYCYQTDSTSLYGSRSSLSRNNSIKSASVAMRKKRLQHRQPSYTSISLRGLNASSRPNSQNGSLASIFDRAKQFSAPVSCGGSGKMIVSPSKVTIERQTSKDALSNDLPEYACSPSPIRWSFLADGKSPTEFEGSGNDVNADTRSSKEAWATDKQTPGDKFECEHSRRESNARRGSGTQNAQHHNWKSSHGDRPSTSAAAARKCRDSPFTCEFEQSTTVLFHQEGEPFNNCCSNYVQCNTYLDQDLQITSEDIHQYLSKGNPQIGDVLNNSKNYPFQPSNALEFQYKNNFANNNTTSSLESGGGYDGRFRRNSSKETNLNQNSSGENGTSATPATGTGNGNDDGACAASSCSSTPLSPTNINLSSSTNNINIVFNSCMERNSNEVKFINTARENVVSMEAHHSGYLPYTYPTYDYTNMSANSLFDKPLGIDELPKDFADTSKAIDAAFGGMGSVSTTASEGRHSSDLQSPIPTGISFESFDAASGHNLLSHRGSYQYSPAPRSPLSPASPASSSLSASINPAATSYVHSHHPHYGYENDERQTHQYHRQHRRNSPASAASSTHNIHNQQYHHHHHFTESFKFSNAFKKVRKRARKYTDFLRKK